MDDRVARHVREIDRCNQRGGRMLSIRDLLDAGTLDEEVASYLAAAIGAARSFLVGARAGGAGKTTVMAALLNFIPDYDIVPTANARVIEKGLHDQNPKCFVAHEIGGGSWYAYIWGQEVTDFLTLTRNHMVAGNLHADDINDVLATPGINQENITDLDLLVFLKLRRSFGGIKRRINAVYENQGGHGAEAFQPIFTWDEARDVIEKSAESRLVGPADIDQGKDLILSIIERNLRTVEDVRSFVLSRYKDFARMGHP